MLKARNLQRGFSLVEVMIAMAVLVVAMTITLLIYDASRKSFKKGENLAEQQQGVRIAYDKLISDLRLAGFNYNPDGDKLRPDEQIEAAYDTAIVFRADFDHEDPTDSTTPEDTLTTGGQFLSISTGNDEIVVFALAKSDGTSTDTLTFEADVADSPRDGIVETVSVPNLALVQNDPPYTLYRITFNNDETTYGNSSFITRTPLVDNIRSLNFRYYDVIGTQLNGTFDLTTTGDDIGGAEVTANMQQRDSINRIGIELEGLTADPELGYLDPGDTDPDTRQLRKFELSGDVTPRNIGMVGIRDLDADVVPPAKPATPVLVPGHCQGLYISWTPNAADDQVVSYKVSYGTATGSYSAQRTAAGTSLWLPGLADGSTYYVAIQAADAQGNISVMSNEASTTTADVNTPDTPGAGTATTDLNGGVKINWGATTVNTNSNPAGDPGSPTIRDLAGYRLYRDNNSGMSTKNLLADETLIGVQSSPSYIDTDVVNCRPYYYQVTAVDTCGNESNATTSVSGNSVAAVAPAAPGNGQAFYTGASQTTTTWDPVVTDENGDSVFIETYNIYRSGLIPDASAPVDGSNFTFLGTVTGSEAYVDNITAPTGYSYWYSVTALDDCPSNMSQYSRPFRAACAFSGDLVFNSPADGSPVAGVVPVVVEAQNGTDIYTKATLVFYHINSGTVTHTEEMIDPGPIWNYNWLATPAGPYIVTAIVENAQGCTKTETIQVAAGFSVGCCLSPPDPDLDPVILSCNGNGANACKEVTYQVINNNCLTAVAIEELSITWVDVVGNGAKLTGVALDATRIWNVTPASPSPAVNIFAAPKPSIAVDRDSTNPVDVTYVFDNVTSGKTGQTFYRDSMTTSFKFRLLNALGEETAITGVCGPSVGIFGNLIVEQHN